MKTKLLLSFLLSFSFYLLSSQVPQGFNYQAIARDGSGNPITGESIPVRLTIQADSAGTIVIWQELFSSVTTNSFGLITLVVGRGSRLAGSAATFDAIDWSVTPKFIKTEVNYGGWKNMGTTRFWSVPYSLYSRIAGNGFSGNYNDLTNKPLLFDGTWVALTGKPSFATVATTGNYNDLINKPTILNSQWTTTGSNIYYNTGNVGIGTASPAYALHVTSNARLNTSIVGDGIELNYYATGNRYSGIDFHSDDTYTDYALRIIRYNSGPDASSSIVHRGKGDLSLFTQDLAAIGFWTTSTQRMTIAANGNVGVGVSNPSFKLDILGRARLQTLDGSAGLWFMNVSNTLNRGFIGMYSDDYVGLYGAGGSTWGLLMNVNNGNVGIGNSSPTSKMVIQAPSVWDDDTPLFEVRNKYGTPVLAVYNNGVRILVEHDASAKSVKGGFAIGGFDNSKVGETVNLMTVSPDSIRFSINNNSGKAVKGGFAIGSFDNSKAIDPKGFMNITTQSSASGAYNTFLGYESGKSNTGVYNSFIGWRSGYVNTGWRNVFIGYATGSHQAFGMQNVFIGYLSGTMNQNGSYNVFLGSTAGQQNQTGQENIFIGNRTGESNVAGSGNTIIGAQAGFRTLGSGNVLLGNWAGYYELGSDKLYIDNSDISTPLIYGDFSANVIRINGNLEYTGTLTHVSDIRLKKNIQGIENVIEKISKIRGVTFEWNLAQEPDLVVNKRVQVGVIAQEVEKVFPELISTNDHGYKMVDYTKLGPILLEAIKDQQKQIETTKQENQELKSQLQTLQEKVDQIEVLLAKAGVK